MFPHTEAEKLNVSGRTVSRWETGSNMPDISLLVELAEFYEVSIPEIIDGERKSEKMDHETKEAVLKVAEYSNEEKRKMGRVTLVYFIVGIVSLIVNVAMRSMEFPDIFLVGFLDGVTSGLPLAAMLLGIFYVTGAMTKVRAFKLKLIGRK